VAICNSRLISLDERGVTFRWKDYRDKGSTRHKTMTLDADEFMRRFLLHVLPPRFHRIRHYGLLSNGNCKSTIPRVRQLLLPPAPPVIAAAEPVDVAPVVVPQPKFVCRHCGAAMLVVDTFASGQPIRAPPSLIAAP